MTPSLNKNIPKLRFPEFKGEWEMKKLGEFTSWSSGGTPPKDNPLFWNGDIPWISASSMRGILYSDSDLKITNGGLNIGSRLVKKGNLLILVRGSMLFNKIPIGIVSRDLAFNQDVKSIEVDKSSSSSFVLYWFKSKEAVLLNMVTGTGIGAGKLDLQDLKKMKVNLPSLPEQTKIASFLTSVDKKLTQLKQKKILLEQYKKGVMQKLFSQELRFKDENGNEYPNWDEKTIADICIKIQSGGTPKSTNQKYYGGEIPFLSISDITKQGKYISHTSNSITEEGLSNSSSWIVPINSIIYSMYASVGFVTINKIPLATSQAVLNMILKENVSLIYVYYYLFDFQKYLAEYITTGTQGNLNAQTVKGFKIQIPDIQEQTKIANFLSAIDEKINHFQLQIEKTENWKKGLLQQLFV
jgi:type I restriction enzyme S subunit